MEKIQLQKQETRYQLKISEKLEKKIRVLCNKFPNTEWSGILFYSYTGSFLDNNISFVAEDLLFMDTGYSTTTEFYLDEANIGSYIVDHDLFGCQCGLIHSHHSMQAFFSGQDSAMLEQEGSSRNHFLSLVVNNSGKYAACVTVKEVFEHAITTKSYYKTFNDELIKRGINESNQTSEIIKVYDLDVIVHNTLFCDDYDELMATIIECAAKKKEREEKEKEKRNLIFPKTPLHESNRTEELSLFDMDYIDYNNYIEEDDEENILTEQQIKEYASQLLAISLIPGNLDMIPYLVKNLPDAAKETFKTIKEYEDSLAIVLDYLIEDKLWEYCCSKCDNTNQFEKVLDFEAAFSSAKKQIQDYIKSLGNNEYLDSIVKMLN
jgi:hypothetical protein